MDRTSLYRAIGAMKAQRWITMHNGTDLRSRRASVTKSGEIALAKAGPDWEMTQRTIVARFGQERWQSFVSELHALIACAASIDGHQRVPGEVT